jgi:hypothetical protein
MNPGDLVKVLPPFDQAFPGTFTVRAVEGNTAFLDGVPEGFSDAFDLVYLEKA